MTYKGKDYDDLVVKGAPGQCWLWVGGHNNMGYGMHKCCLAHRVAYERMHGPIPEGMMVCHSCDNPGCINPDHLWLGTNADNQRDASRKLRQPAQSKTHCLHGHEFTDENTIRRGFRARQCRECGRISQRKYQSKKRKTA